jgi:hypothetical protein
VPDDINLGDLIGVLDFGSSIAEKDTLLQTARIETSVFNDIFLDRVDLILGTKGSGKSALFKIFTNHLQDHFYEKRRIVIINGAEEPAGDPIFQFFKPRFDSLSELDFQNFWRVYLVALINTHLFNNSRYATELGPAKSAINDFQRVCVENKFPFEKKAQGLKYIVDWALQAVRSLRLSGSMKPDGTFGVTVEPSGKVSSDSSPEVPTATPIFINEIRTHVLQILRKCNLKVWFLIDRLDEIFPRRSDLETKALRSLLLTTNSFPEEALRLKVFLRDDIFSSLIDPETGFTALTHVTARSSDTLNWDRDLICKLIVKRIYCNEPFRKAFGVDAKRLERDKDYQLESFYQVFPRKGERGMDTLAWICSRCQDAQDVITPRDVIDLLQAARNRQVSLFEESPQIVKHVIDFPALKYGYEHMSDRKVNTYLEAEFPHLWADFLSKFRNQKSTLSRKALARILGTDDTDTLRLLEEIGFLKVVPRKALYSVPYLYRHGMNMIQGTETE